MTCIFSPPPFSEAFTFLVPTLLTLAKFAQPQPQTTAPLSHLPKMPMGGCARSHHYYGGTRGEPGGYLGLAVSGSESVLGET